MSWYIFYIPFSSFIPIRQGLTLLSSLNLYGCFVNGNMIILPGAMLRKESYKGSILGAKFSEWPALPSCFLWSWYDL